MRVERAAVSFQPYTARTPIKYGAVEMSEVTFCLAEVEVVSPEGQSATGHGGIFLADLWAFPDPAVSHEAKDAAMCAVSRHVACWLEGQSRWGHPLELGMAVQTALTEITATASRNASLPFTLPRLAAVVAASPLDAALHDAYGNLYEQDTYTLYGAEAMTTDLSPWLGQEFVGKYPADYLRPQYTKKLPIFHLVGGLDKISRQEISSSDPADGLPIALEDWIAKEGIYCFKLKLSGRDLTWDLERTLDVAKLAREVLAKRRQTGLMLTADFNEQCTDLMYLEDYLKHLEERDPAAYQTLLYVEQPISREAIPERAVLERLSRLKPVVVDEGISGPDEFPQIRDSGWSGVALKTGKGQSHCLLLIAQATDHHLPYSVQDLANPGIAFIQSAGLAARSYTLAGVEYNSRQYYPQASRDAQQEYPDLFGVENGTISTAQITGPGLGFGTQHVV